MVAFVLLIGACSEPVEVQTETLLQGQFAVPNLLRTLEMVEPEMRYLVWLPEAYGEDREKEWPMIVFLHGSGDADYDSAWVSTYGLASVLRLGEQPDNFDFVVVAPQAAAGSAWWTGNQVEVMDALVADAVDTYLVDPERVYLTGLSMGGYGSWFLGTYNPDRYAAMVSISGSGYRTPRLPGPEVCALAQMPVRAIHGDQDTISTPGVNLGIVAEFEAACEADVQFDMLEGEDHFSTYERAYRDPELYEWMLSHSK